MVCQFATFHDDDLQGEPYYPTGGPYRGMAFFYLNGLCLKPPPPPGGGPAKKFSEFFSGGQYRGSVHAIAARWVVKPRAGGRPLSALIMAAAAPGPVRGSLAFACPLLSVEAVTVPMQSTAVLRGAVADADHGDAGDREARQRRHRRGMLDAGPLLREKRTSIIGGLMSAFDPERTS